MNTKAVIKNGFLDRLKAISGIKTDDALARTIGISPSALSRLKRGDEPTMRILIGIHEAFGFTPAEVIDLVQTSQPGETKRVA